MLLPHLLVRPLRIWPKFMKGEHILQLLPIGDRCSLDGTFRPVPLCCVHVPDPDLVLLLFLLWVCFFASSTCCPSYPGRPPSWRWRGSTDVEVMCRHHRQVACPGMSWFWVHLSRSESHLREMTRSDSRRFCCSSCHTNRKQHEPSPPSLTYLLVATQRARACLGSENRALGNRERRRIPRRCK